ncbi:hypothetical protein DRF67_18705 [Chryseobacterium pennipullorum]|uniref:TM2 domain-containing protein n=2 Tax=Chryseobacterium pennipullorum TaxID=2258963 RepID=A0A3D9AR53_9FLAO|nr:hypothetical protein DRF67_18705 [Chryseobacterium pennipullorum]
MSPEQISLLKAKEQKSIQVVTKNKKDKNTAAILSFFLGGIGIHRFYLGQTIMGLAYLLFCWTFIPAFIALIDFFAFIFTTQDKFDQKYNNQRLP